MARHLRQATPADEAAIVALTRAAYEPYTDLLGYPPLPVTENYAPRIAANEVWLLEDGPPLAGLLVLERHTDHAMIYSVAIDPARHNQRLGSALLDFAEATAMAWGVPELRLYTNAKMIRNQAIYTARGFRETGRRPIPGRPGFLVVDMVKPLASTPEP